MLIEAVMAPNLTLHKRGPIKHLVVLNQHRKASFLEIAPFLLKFLRVCSAKLLSAQISIYC